eukprot:CAMPEP_0171324508 /NCGR_PEP_ID=MMETSP0816-20121228/116228_1 /TAXON_ID=420281 /ORGANISM="Proboscia inermis, Strain CCAP1064/1" /LENGTH=380 /DNA_ID=CAMNT_0011823453 /DNA_START=590 /DNA_END=1732 /DNA_ORIENTATION=+
MYSGHQAVVTLSPSPSLKDRTPMIVTPTTENNVQHFFVGQETKHPSSLYLDRTMNDSMSAVKVLNEANTRLRRKSANYFDNYEIVDDANAALLLASVKGIASREISSSYISCGTTNSQPGIRDSQNGLVEQLSLEIERFSSSKDGMITSDNYAIPAMRARTVSIVEDEDIQSNCHASENLNKEFEEKDFPSLPNTILRNCHRIVSSGEGELTKSQSQLPNNKRSCRIKSRKNFAKSRRIILPGKKSKTILRKKFSWKNYPELKAFLVANREEYLRHSTLNYTLKQKQYNNKLTERLLKLAAETGYVFDSEAFDFVTVRDRIRCYFKSYVQSNKKRGVIIGYATRKAGLVSEEELVKSAKVAGKIVVPLKRDTIFSSPFME